MTCPSKRLRFQNQARAAARLPRPSAAHVCVGYSGTSSRRLTPPADELNSVARNGASDETQKAPPVKASGSRSR